jgi:ankyrin repeat protein
MTIINNKKDGVSPLHNSANKNHLDCVKELLQAGAVVNAKDKVVIIL